VPVEQQLPAVCLLFVRQRIERRFCAN